jgi:hypothetical protein
MTLRAAALLMILMILGTRVASADSTEPNSPDLALALSAGGTLVSLGLVVGGWHELDRTTVGSKLWTTTSAIGLESTLITPSLGPWYAGKFMTTGLALRLAGIAAGGLAALNVCSSENCHSDRSAVLLLGGLGVLTYAAGVGWDIATVRATTREVNARRHAPVITPSVLTSPSGHAAYGLGLGGSF